MKDRKNRRPRTPRALRVLTALALAVAIGAVGCKHTVPEDDGTLTQTVQTRLSGDASLHLEPIQATVQQGVVTLNGSVSSDTVRSLAANDAALIPGIRTVVNNLTVQPAPAVRNGKMNRRDKPAPGVRSAQEEPPPLSSADNTQAAAPIERPGRRAGDPDAPASPPPASFGTPPFLPPAAFRAMTLPAETTLAVRINTPLDSATAQPGDAFTGSIASDVVDDGLVILAQGTPVSGRVETVQEAAHFKGKSLLTITLTGIDRKGDKLALTTDEFSKAGNGRGKNTAEKVGGGAAIGAILGGILGGGKGAAIGAGVGGTAGAGVQAATKGQQVQIPAETLVRFHLTSPLVVRVSTADKANSDSRELQNHDR